MREFGGASRRRSLQQKIPAVPMTGRMETAGVFRVRGVSAVRLPGARCACTAGRYTPGPLCRKDPPAGSQAFLTATVTAARSKAQWQTEPGPGTVSADCVFRIRNGAG